MDGMVKPRPPQPEGAQKPSRDAAMEAVRTLLAWAGDDPKREGLLDTPGRVVEAFEEWFKGYAMDPVKELSRTFEDVQGYDDIVLLKNMDVEMYRTSAARRKAATLGRSVGRDTHVDPYRGIGRNDPCPCGSGRKFKKCHGA